VQGPSFVTPQEPNETSNQKSDSMTKVVEGKVERTHDFSTLETLKDIQEVWPHVVERVKSVRKLTWTLLSSGVLLEKFEDGILHLGFANAGAAESFTRSGSDKVLTEAFKDVAVGIKRTVVTVSGISQVLRDNQEVFEEVESENSISGKDLLVRELGATIISKSEN
jgi:hypothetical protein